MKISGISPIKTYRSNNAKKNQNAPKTNVQNNIQNHPKQNINFGKFLDKEAEAKVKEIFDQYKETARVCCCAKQEFITLLTTDLAEIHTDPETGKVVLNLLKDVSDFKTPTGRSRTKDILYFLDEYRPQLRQDVTWSRPPHDANDVPRPYLSMFAEYLHEIEEAEGFQEYYDSLPPEEKAVIDRKKQEEEEARRREVREHSLEVQAEIEALEEARIHNWWF